MATPDFEPVVRAIIAAGESYYAEFKTAWTYGPDARSERELKDVAKDIGEAVVAFGNSDGGDLLVGVEDSGAITGVPWDGDKLKYLLQAPQQQVKDAAVGVIVREVEVDGHRVLLFRVAEHPTPLVTSDGRCLWRKQASSEPVPPLEIERRRKHRFGDTAFESSPVPTATLDDLKIPWHRFATRPQLARFAESKDAVGLLRYWNLIESRNGNTVLRRAALLLFGAEPLRWHPNNRLRIRWSFQPTEGYGRDLRSREVEVGGPVADMAQAATRALFSGMRVESRQDSLFTTGQLLPQEAVEECVVNALVHRNYAIEGSAIEIVFFPDRVEFKSPGRLPEPLTVADLRVRRGAHRSRNPLVMRVMRDLGWARDQGEGMRRIFGAMSQVELNEPELEELADTFVIRLSTRSLYDESTRGWIAAYGPYGLEPDERRYMVGLKKAGGHLSVDRLARQLAVGFDQTKKCLVALEKKGLVWHAARSRSYHLVEPLVVPQERAYRVLARARVTFDKAATITRAQVQSAIGSEDPRSVEADIDRLKEGGILAPAGKGQWRLVESFLAYVRSREL